MQKEKEKKKKEKERALFAIGAYQLADVNQGPSLMYLAVGKQWVQRGELMDALNQKKLKGIGLVGAVWSGRIA